MIVLRLIVKPVCIGLLLFMYSFSQECSECFDHRISLYDLNNTVPRPTVDSEIVQWLGLFYGSAGMRNYALNVDPKKGCNFYLDGALLQGANGDPSNLVHGSQYTNLPPAGCIKSSDYLLTGSIEKSQTGYAVTVELQASWSREIVASHTIAISSTDGAMKAGENAAAGIGSIFDKIMEFEKDKRATDVNVAMRDKSTKTSTPEMELTPKKKTADINEEVDVEIKLIDCDGVPLANRKVIFEGNPDEGITPSTGGKFTTANVTTDGAGIAHAMFKCESSSKIAVLHAYYQHEKPHGRPETFYGESSIAINKSIIDLWEITVEASSVYTYRHKADENLLDQWDNNHVFSKRGQMTAIVKNSERNTFSFDTDADTPEVISWHGTGNGSETRVERSYFLDKLRAAAWRNISQTATTDSGNFTLKFHYDTLFARENPGVSVGYFEATFPMKLITNRSEQGCIYEGADQGCSSDNSEGNYYDTIISFLRQ